MEVTNLHIYNQLLTPKGAFLMEERAPFECSAINSTNPEGGDMERKRRNKQEIHASAAHCVTLVSGPLRVLCSVLRAQTRFNPFQKSHLWLQIICVLQVLSNEGLRFADQAGRLGSPVSNCF